MKSEKIYQIIFVVLSDEATEEEYCILSRWLEESEKNRKEYEQLQQLYKLSSFTPKEQYVDVDKAWETVSRQTVRKKRKSNFTIWLRYAAVIAIVVGVGITAKFIDNPEQKNLCVIEEVAIDEFNEPTLLLENGERIALNGKAFVIDQEEVVIVNDMENKLVYESKEKVNKGEILNNHLIIPKGKTYQLQLADGSRIWLNSQSELIYPTQFTGNKREVTLKGEAFFEIAENKEKPFYVKTDDVEVQVLGTKFNVCCYDTYETVQTTLVSGSVAIQTNYGEKQIIIPSEQFTYYRENHAVITRKVDTELYTSWIEGKYIFRGSKLEDIILRLQHWYDFTPVYQDESLKDKLFSMTLDRESTLDQILEVISYTSDVKLEKADHIINIKKKRRE